MIVRTRSYTTKGKIWKEEYEVVDIEDFAQTIMMFCDNKGFDKEQYYTENLQSGIALKRYKDDTLYETYELMNFDNEIIGD